MDKIRGFLENDRFAKHCGIRLLEVSEGRARAEMTIGPQHLNGVGIAHGAAIFALADFVFAASSNSHGTIAVAINVHISFLKALREGTLTAQAEETSLNPKLGTYSIRVTDQDGDLVATFEGMVYRKKDPVPA